MARTKITPRAWLVIVVIAVAVTAYGVITGPTSPGYLSDADAIARVEASWGPCLDALGVSTDGATVERLPSSTGVGGHASLVTVSDGAQFLVGVARTKGAAVRGDIAERDVDLCEARG
jgi:hypothetical protein